MRHQSHWFLNAFLCLTAASLAQPPGTAGAAEQPSKLTFDTAKFELKGPRAEQQLVISGQGAKGVFDVTHDVKLESTNPAVVRIDGTVARAAGNGTAQLKATIGDQSAVADVTVSSFDQPQPVRFNNELLAALTKSSCNMGACHGSPSGKGGFRLSLRGFDPPLDILTLRSEYFGRRTNILKPEESLILQKALMEVAHGGGRRLHKGDASYTVLRNWIAEGLQLDPPETATLTRVQVSPNLRTLNAPADRQQLQVTGFFSDGSQRDLTALTVFSSSNESVATVTPDGLVEKIGRGETAVLARYLDKMDTSYITFLEDVPGFQWSNPPEANFVDTKIFSKLKQLQILPSDLCSDEEFIRRAYLDLTGRLPRIEETQAFLADSADTRRAKLVDRLLDSNDFAEFWTLKWSDILRSNAKKVTDTGVYKFQHWIYESIRTDKGLDQFARELLTASGSVFENPAANYWRTSRDPNDATETTAQLFLGIRIQCAKCHNHPFERWSQDNYYGIAAAFTRIGRQKGAAPDEEIIHATRSGEIQQPRTGQTMKVHLLLKGDVDVPAEQDRRQVFADWLTAADNPFFAKASVNRIWGHLMGRGIVEPVDDFRDSNPPSNAPLLDELSQQFAQHGFSRKWAIRTIMNSRTYQLSSKKNDFNADDEIYASHATTRLLTAEQLLDAICQVTSVPESFKGLPPGTRAVALPDPPTDHYFLKVFGQPQREMACQCERSNESNLSQALQMINGPTVHNKLRADNGRIHQMVKDGKSDDEIIETLYLAALCRKPVDAEIAASKNHIASSQDRTLALEDVGWAILNSKEFLFQH
ncbi:DUF1553 domain-containing protein [bacterium]|nr:DUF1553 domain-containing protein [bacterium]